MCRQAVSISTDFPFFAFCHVCFLFYLSSCACVRLVLQLFSLVEKAHSLLSHLSCAYLSNIGRPSIRCSFLEYFSQAGNAAWCQRRKSIPNPVGHRRQAPVWHLIRSLPGRYVIRSIFVIWFVLLDCYGHGSATEGRALCSSSLITVIGSILLFLCSNQILENRTNKRFHFVYVVDSGPDMFYTLFQVLRLSSASAARQGDEKWPRGAHNENRRS